MNKKSEHIGCSQEVLKVQSYNYKKKSKFYFLPVMKILVKHAQIIKGQKFTSFSSSVTHVNTFISWSLISLTCKMVIVRLL